MGDNDDTWAPMDQQEVPSIDGPALDSVGKFDTDGQMHYTKLVYRCSID